MNTPHHPLLIPVEPWLTERVRPGEHTHTTQALTAPTDEEILAQPCVVAVTATQTRHREAIRERDTALTTP